MTKVATGRRAQNRVNRNSELILAANEIIRTEGLEALTMQAVAARVGCAVGTIYTYFDSKSDLLSVLQVAAMETLFATFERSHQSWDQAISEAELDLASAAVVRLVASSRVFIALGEHHPREFELLQMMISAREYPTKAVDQDEVLPVALALLNMLMVFIEEAILAGALLAPATDPVTGEIRSTDSSLSRTIRWAGGINGALLVSNVGTYEDDRITALFDGQRLALSLADDLLLGWGASRDALEAAFIFIDHLAASGQLIQLAEEAVVDLT
ncbi:MAG: helix-turn-helix domain-containing protein, partial [Microthrixaceae bacterium]